MKVYLDSFRIYQEVITLMVIQAAPGRPGKRSVMDWLKGKKTHIIATLMVLVSLVRLMAGDTSFAEFFTSNDINLLLEGLGIGALRAGMANTR